MTSAKIVGIIASGMFLIAIGLAQGLPIKPARTVSFTTDEGSFMDVDVSADGKTLIFDLLGDLYTVPATGGKASQITRGMAINLRPTWSPSGNRIAYISDATGDMQLHVRDVSGTYHAVLKSSHPYWTGGLNEELQVQDPRTPLWMPDGNYIALGGRLYGLAGNEMPLPANIKSPVKVSTDGRFVYYLEARQIWRRGLLDGSNIAVAPLEEGVQGGELSPDARWWAYVAERDGRKALMVLDVANHTTRTAVPSLLVMYPYYGPYKQRHFSFSSDSKALFIGYGGKIHRIDLGSGDDQVVAFSADVKVDCGPLDHNSFRISYVPRKAKYTRYATASPDGKRMVFTALGKIYIKDLPDGRARVLAPQSINQFEPVWSPDGRWIAYVSWSDTVGGCLWRVPSTEGKPEPLTAAAGWYERPAWSPDGSTLVVVKGDLAEWRFIGARAQLLLVSFDGNPPRLVDDSVTQSTWPVFSMDGSRIIYVPGQISGDSVKSVPLWVSKNLEGKDPLTLLSMSWLETNISPELVRQSALSPDGRFMVYSKNENMYLVLLCPLAASAVVKDARQRPSVIRFASGIDPCWEEGGKVLSWTYANRFYRISPDKIIAAAQEKLAAGASDRDSVTVAPAPDQVVNLDVSYAGSHAQGTLAIRDARIITMQGDTVIERGTIIIKDGRIAKVGPTEAVKVPDDAKVIEMQGATIMPGIIDLHMHIGTPADVYQQPSVYLSCLAFGVTTALDPQTNYASFGYRERLESGQTLGPRLFSVGECVNGSLEVTSAAEASAIVKKRAALGGTVVKQYMLRTRLEREWLAIAAREGGLNFTNEGPGDPVFAVAMMKDGSTGIEHNPYWGDTYKDVTSFFAATGTYFDPTLQVRYGAEAAATLPFHRYWSHPDAKVRRYVPAETMAIALMQQAPTDMEHTGYKAPAMIAARISKAGGLVTLGSHGNVHGLSAQNELWALQMGGLSNLEALKAATINGAMGIGVQADLGSIETGKIADLLILNKNPLEDIHNSREIRCVMKDGILYNGDTLDEIWPEAKQCPEWRLNVALVEKSKNDSP